MRKLSVGDRITFKAATRDSYRKATRVVKGFDGMGRPLVGYFGCSRFIVKPEEILALHPAEE